MLAHRGAHPRIGALDIAPVVYLRPQDAGAACAEALVLGDRLGEELRMPVFLYGSLGRAGRGPTSAAAVRRRWLAGSPPASCGPTSGRPAPRHRRSGAGGCPAPAGGLQRGAGPPGPAPGRSSDRGLDQGRRIRRAPRAARAGDLAGSGRSGPGLHERRGPRGDSAGRGRSRHRSLRTACPGRARGPGPPGGLGGVPRRPPFRSSGTIEDALAAAQPDG